MTLQKSKRSGKRSVPVAIEIRATVPAASVRRRLLGRRDQRRVRNDQVIDQIDPNQTAHLWYRVEITIPRRTSLRTASPRAGLPARRISTRLTLAACG